MNTTPGPTIEVFADIWCPFTHVGLRTIGDQRARSGRTDVAIWIRAWPLELVNGAPLNPAVTWEHVDHLREQGALDLFRHFDVDRFPSSTLDALALANRAYRTDPQVREPFAAQIESGVQLVQLRILQSTGSSSNAAARIV